MSSPPIEAARSELLANATGAALEIGFGTGLNLPHYPETITQLTTIDVNAGMAKKALRRIEASSIPVDNRVLDGTALPMPDRSFDTVVTTWTLCSIDRVDVALAEIRRVLKPGGKLLFAEHGLSEEAKIQRWQHRLNPLQRVFALGCNLNRNMEHLIAEAGFRFDELRCYYMDTLPKIHGYTYQGIATK